MSKGPGRNKRVDWLIDECMAQLGHLCNRPAFSLLTQLISNVEHHNRKHTIETCEMLAQVYEENFGMTLGITELISAARNWAKH